MTRHPEWLSLEEGESVVWSGRPRRMSIAGTVVGAVVRTAVLAGALLAVGSGVADQLLPETAGPVAVPSLAKAVPTVAVLGGAGLAVVWGLAQITWAYLVVSNVDYVLTDRNLYKKTGVGSETVTRVGVDRVQSTSLSKDVLGNLFDYGSVAVSTAGGSGVEMVVRDLSAPGELQRELRRLVNETGGGTAAGGLAGVGDEVLRELVAEARQLRETTTAVEEVLEG
jgi:uncharacterized membrane protein YdbT with pleckstrin-like domain